MPVAHPTLKSLKYIWFPHLRVLTSEVIALSFIRYVRGGKRLYFKQLVKVRVWHICYHLPLSLSKLLEFRLFLLEELPDCLKRSSFVFKRRKRHPVFVTSIKRHFVTYCLRQPSFSHSVSFQIIVTVKWLNQWALARAVDAVFPVLKYLTLAFPFFAFIFLTFIFWKKKTAQAVKRLVGLILTRTGFKFCVMNPFLRSFYFVVLLRHTGFKQLMIQGLYIFCKEPMVRHRCWVRHKT